MSSSGDGFEVLGYFAGFWLFVFSPKFRNTWLLEFKEEPFLVKFLSLIQAGISIIFGVVLPGYLIYYLVQQIAMP